MASRVVSATNRSWLYNFLANNRYQGEILLPRTIPIGNIVSSCSFDSKYEANLVNPTINEEVQSAILRIFYKHAPVPVCLGLYRDEKITDFLQNEINLFKYSGVSVALQDPSKCNKVFGCGFSLYFEADDEFRPDIPVEVWHNNAARYIENTLKCSENAIHLWRNYQFLHLKHFCQNIIRQENAAFGIHLAQLGVEKEYRGHISKTIIRNICNDVWSKGGILTTVSNFPAFGDFLESDYGNNVQLVDEVAYDDIELTVDGECVFKRASNLGSMRYYALVDNTHSK